LTVCRFIANSYFSVYALLERAIGGGTHARQSTFSLFMNAATNDRAALPPPTVLVVENDVIIRMAVSAYLRECGFKIIEASSADEAKRVLEADIAVDLVFCEVNIPGAMDGFGLATWIRRGRSRIKIILTSGVKRAAKEAGDLCEHGPILAKPYDHRELERHIRLLLAQDRSKAT
jgi:DNA-binding response OmpR family regulator